VIEVEHLVIGAGVAGMTVAHFLGNRAVVVDPHPDRYKIGESIIPQHFHHPELWPLVERIRGSASACPKTGTLFVTSESASYFPILDDAIPADQARAVHVERAELERISREVLGTVVKKERVVSLDFATREVVTDVERYRVRGLVIDCSGPAMVVASALGLVRELWPIWAGWAYFDVERVDTLRFREWLQSGDREYLRYDGVARGLVRGGDHDSWDPSHVTMLTAIEKGVWSWQIPLFSGSRLSFGIVSRKGEVTDELHRELTLRTLGPQYVAQRRRFDHSGPFNVFHQRQRFARVATELAGPSWVLLGDAAFFGDPVYSVGTGVAVSHAIQLAELLQEREWSDTVRDAWQRQQRETFARIEEAYQNWYGGDVGVDGATARKIQNQFLIGEAFRVRLADDYMSLWGAAEPKRPQETEKVVEADSLLLELSIGDERVLCLIEPDPERGKRALAHGAGHALSHLDLELATSVREPTLELARRFARTLATDDPMSVLRDAGARLHRRLFAGQRAPCWPLALRSGRPRPRSLWPFDAESAGLELGLRVATFREGRTDEEALRDEDWLRSRGFAVKRDGRNLVAAHDEKTLEGTLELLRAEPASSAEFVTRARELGTRFGYPACCVEAFVRIRRRDDVMLFADVLPRAGDRVPLHSLFLNGALALVSHAPCAGTCSATLELGRRVEAELERESPGFSANWRTLGQRLHALDVRGHAFLFDVEGDDVLRVISAVEMVAPSAGVIEPQLRQVSDLTTLRIDRERALLVSDDREFRSSLFARHDATSG
jgi:flavin-dependent dehydrogenase